MRDAIKRAIDLYASDGVPTGGFLRAVLENDLFTAFGVADEENARDLHEIVRYIYNEVPSTCHGSRERVRAWLDKHADARNARRDAARVAEADEAIRNIGAPIMLTHGFVAVPTDPDLCRCGEARAHAAHGDTSQGVTPASICECGHARHQHQDDVMMDERMTCVAIHGCECIGFRAVGPGITPTERADLGLGVEG